MELSLVVPLLNEAASLPELHQWIEKALKGRSYELIFVDDGSKDKSWSIIEDLQKKHKEVRGIKFQRNYGKSAALHVGFAAAEVVVVVVSECQ